MGRPRVFDEDEAVRAAVALFAGRAYDGVSVDDLVSHLGVHRNSLYKTLGGKRGLYLTALRRHLADDVHPLLDALAGASDTAAALRLVTSADLGLLLLAAAERAPVDEEVGTEVKSALAAVDQAIADALGVSSDLATAVTAAAWASSCAAPRRTPPPHWPKASARAPEEETTTALVRIEGDHLVVVIEGLDKLWAFKGSLTIPLANVRGATVDPGIATEPKGVRAPGSHVPGVIIAGTFHQDGEKVFWDVKDRSIPSPAPAARHPAP